MWIVRPLLIRVFVWTTVVLGSVGGCQNNGSPQQTGATAQVEPVLSQGKAAAATPTVAPSRYDEAAFSVDLRAPGSIKVGETAKLLITLLPKSPFHVNAEYPHRFKVGSLQGATTPSTTIARDPAKLAPAKLEIEVPIVASRTGMGALEGEVALSVCTDDKCLMEKRTLKVSFQVQ